VETEPPVNLVGDQFVQCGGVFIQYVHYTTQWRRVIYLQVFLLLLLLLLLLASSYTPTSLIRDGIAIFSTTIRLAYSN